MLFNSLVFIFFLFLVVLLYYISPHPLRWILLLIASVIFYAAWDPRLLLLIVFVIFINYLISLALSQGTAANEKKRKTLLILSIMINFGMLLFFKYTVFLTDSIARLCIRLGLAHSIPAFSIVLPMGISFYTFQAAGYTIDVYRKQYMPQRNFFRFALFILFFPQLVAGPIERADRLLPQLFTRKKFTTENWITGSKFILFGFFKKIVIADRIADIVNTVYDAPLYFSGLSYIIATFLFAFQIYCDFSGYSDIAVGCAKWLGIDLMQNFKQPYLSKSIREFWRRWHISLSGWFKDYVYFPLGGSRVSKSRHAFNTMVTFLVSGLWHGANWTFVLWGALHGFFQIMENFSTRLFAAIGRKKSNKKETEHPVHTAAPIPVRILQTLLTFILVCYAWIFFRANTIQDAFTISSGLFSDIAHWTNPQYVYNILNGLGIQLIETVLVFLALAILFCAEAFSGERIVHDALMDAPLALRWSFYLIVAAAILSIGVFSHAGEFIYFQF